MHTEVERKTVGSLRTFLKEHIKGQDHVIDEISPILIAGHRGLSPQNLPRGVFFFIGPTGTGKTEVTKLAADYLSGMEDDLIRFDMSEFGGPQGLARLIGDSDCPVGILGTRIGTKKEGFLLFDEFEKASSEVLDLFLQILDAGRISLWNKETLNLNKFFIICTSNIGSSRMKDMIHSSYMAKKQAILSSLESYLRPELLGRFQNIVVFNSLDYDVQAKICKSIAEKEINRLRKESGYRLKLSESAILFLMRVGFNEKMGARPMRNAIVTNIAKLLVSDDDPYENYFRPNEDREIIADQYSTKLMFRHADHDGNKNFTIIDLNAMKECLVS